MEMLISEQKCPALAPHFVTVAQLPELILVAARHEGRVMSSEVIELVDRLKVRSLHPLGPDSLIFRFGAGGATAAVHP